MRFVLMVSVDKGSANRVKYKIKRCFIFISEVQPTFGEGQSTNKQVKRQIYLSISKRAMWTRLHISWIFAKKMKYVFLSYKSKIS